MKTSLIVEEVHGRFLCTWWGDCPDILMSEFFGFLPGPAANRVSELIVEKHNNKKKLVKLWAPTAIVDLIPEEVLVLCSFPQNLVLAPDVLPLKKVRVRVPREILRRLNL